MNENTIKNWTNLAEYDLETAKAMYKTGRYLYVAFTCQQAIEKILKAIYVKELQQTPPYTHNLIRLQEKLSVNAEIKNKYPGFFEELNSFYIQSRYTEEIQKIASSITDLRAKEILKRTGDVFLWLKTLV